jgi:hypothetical protein
VVPNERVGAYAHGIDVLANCAALAPHVLPDVFSCAHGSAYDAEASNLDYIIFGGKWEEGREGAGCVLCYAFTEEEADMVLGDAWHVNSAFGQATSRSASCLKELTVSARANRVGLIWPMRYASSA